jgi:uncharacterized protein YecE (DUF72 family)
VNFIGTAGWNVPRDIAHRFPTNGTHLERYAKILNCAEINSSFYRAHSFTTYRRWAESTPPTFRFAVKMPRAITHEAQLRRARAPVAQFLAEVKGLGRKLGPLLIQLPPSLQFEARIAANFFFMLRALHRGAVVCEPRHASWFEHSAERLLLEHRIGRVAADPPTAKSSGRPAAATQRVIYYRLHGAPRVYWSNYSQEHLLKLASELQAHSTNKARWIIFDNTAAGFAAANALQLRALLD